MRFLSFAFLTFLLPLSALAASVNDCLPALSNEAVNLGIGGDGSFIGASASTGVLSDEVIIQPEPSFGTYQGAAAGLTPDFLAVGAMAIVDDNFTISVDASAVATAPFVVCRKVGNDLLLPGGSVPVDVFGSAFVGCFARAEAFGNPAGGAIASVDDDVGGTTSGFTANNCSATNELVIGTNTYAEDFAMLASGQVGELIIDTTVQTGTSQVLGFARASGAGSHAACLGIDESALGADPGFATDGLGFLFADGTYSTGCSAAPTLNVPSDSAFLEDFSGDQVERVPPITPLAVLGSGAGTGGGETGGSASAIPVPGGGALLALGLGRLLRRGRDYSRPHRR